MSSQEHRSGRLLKAPENFIDAEGVRTVFREAKAGRRDFVRGAFAAALAGAAAPVAFAQANPGPAAGGDPNILELPEHSKGLGQPVVTDGRRMISSTVKTCGVFSIFSSEPLTISRCLDGSTSHQP